MRASERRFWLGLLLAIVVIGILSRITQTGFRILDKYLGDALYAAMVYALLRLTNRIQRVAMWAAITMTAIELFQLTSMGAGMLYSRFAAVRIFGRLLGAQFSMLDLLAYAVGIGCITVLDRSRSGLAGRTVQSPNNPSE